ncbi:TIGR02453 family protein [Auraticoccus sp. F435]|uniref:TIGR02453 family protein n=1 Tax=Auraticoccus cholistanensis TaxID=2656650 RepID=A0A6A9V1I5_9ACTN|nr:DUF2461 domain-containing protein [Auraticoccus cholistanensis]MVA77160.1 TIGR02453 family protein [Auraticoccus cholistanensis]
MAERFAGFPEAALDFYDDLELDNSRSFWERHRHVYEECVRAPMVALTAELAEQFGTAKLFRPHRDVRFAKDKSPYKTHQGAYVAAADHTGWYVELSAAGVRVAAGRWGGDGETLARVRRDIAGRPGAELERLLAEARSRGLEVSGDRLRTAPRGWPRDHPRIELLRHTTLNLGRSYGFDPVISDHALVGRVRHDWELMRPLVEWLAARAG